jgi:hypothetical protein
MAIPEQLPSAKYLFGGQITLSNFEIPDTSRSFEEDAESVMLPNGTFGTEITYSRRETCQASARCLSGTPGATPHTFLGGTIASGTITLADGSTASAWKIRSATIRMERGIRMVDFDLIQLGDKITA